MGADRVRRMGESANAVDTPTTATPRPARSVARRHASAVNGGEVLIQAKLEVGPAGDRHEQEADRVAAAVMRTIRSGPAALPADGRDDVGVDQGPDVPIQRFASNARIQPRTAGPEIRVATGVSRIQAKAAVPMVGPEGGALDADTDAKIRQATGGGTPLDDELRRSMEGGFGADFSGVRVHHDATADDLNQRIQAKAFTTGSDIFFRSGGYDPSTSAGQELVAHELTHVVQQGAAPTVRRDFDLGSAKLRPTQNMQGLEDRERQRFEEAAEDYKKSGGAGGTGGAFDKRLEGTEEERAATEARMGQQKQQVDAANDFDPNTLPKVFWHVYKQNPALAIQEFGLTKAQGATLAARAAGKVAGMDNMEFFRGKAWSGKDISPEAMDARAEAKGKIATPQDLFTAKEIQSHLSHFANGAHAFVPVPASEAFVGKWQKWDGFHGWGAIKKENEQILGKDSNFVGTVDEANVVNAKAHSEHGIETLENELSIFGKAWSNSKANPRKEMMRWVIPRPKFELDAEMAGVVLKMATGQEVGADPKEWVAGGFTKGGAREATLESIPAADLITLLAAGEIKQKIERYPETGDGIPKGSTEWIYGKKPSKDATPGGDA